MAGKALPVWVEACAFSMGTCSKGAVLFSSGVQCQEHVEAELAHDQWHMSRSNFVTPGRKL
jgi:hypothetical protein